MCVSYRLDSQNQTAREILSAARRRGEKIPITEGDVYPKAIVPVLRVEDRKIVVVPMMWGFPLEGKKSVNFNARAETLGRIPMFRNAKPVVIPTCGFFEWKKGEKREKFLFTAPDSEITWLAGVWDDFSSRADELFPFRFTMITTAPSESFAAYHDREPAALSRQESYEWLESKDLALIRKRPPKLNALAV